MLLRSVFEKCLHDQWRAVLGWAVFASLMPAMYVAIYPSFGSAKAIQQFIDQLPDAYKALFASTGVDMSTATGYLNIELFSFVGPLLLLAVGVALGASATAGEEEGGTADLLLANPIRRSKVVVEKAGAMVLWTFAVAAAVWVGVAIAATLVGVELALDRVAIALVDCALLGVAYGGVALLAGALLAKRMAAFAVAFILAVVAYFVNALAPMVTGWKDLQVVSPFYWYIGNDPLRNGFAPVHALALVVLAAACIALAAVVWERRDIHG
jgi:ABC-2 type transport system permease protein